MLSIAVDYGIDLGNNPQQCCRYACDIFSIPVRSRFVGVTILVVLRDPVLSLCVVSGAHGSSLHGVRQEGTKETLANHVDLILQTGVQKYRRISKRNRELLEN